MNENTYLEQYINNIKLVKVSNNYYKIMNKSDNKEMIINSPKIRVPFGLENNKYTYNKKNIENYILKLNLDNEEFRNFIIYFEKTIWESQCKVDSKDYSLSTQIVYFDKYTDKLITKIKTNYNKIITKIYSNNIEVSLFDIKKNTILEVSLVPSLYINNNNIVIKWTCKYIKI